MSAVTLFRNKQAEYLKRADVSGAIIIALITDEFGTDCYGWEAETFRMEIESTWGVKLPDLNYEKLLAFLTVLTTDKFEQSLDGFIHICNALVGYGADFQQYDPATVSEMCKTIAEVTLLDPPEEGKFNFNEEIRQYIRQELDYEGYGKTPRMLAPFAAEGTPTPETLPMDDIEAKSYFDRQDNQLEILDLEVQAHLANIFNDLKTLPLRNADQGAKDKLVEAYPQLLTR